jgi:hypothetical protein
MMSVKFALWTESSLAHGIRREVTVAATHLKRGMAHEFGHCVVGHFILVWIMEPTRLMKPKSKNGTGMGQN